MIPSRGSCHHPLRLSQSPRSAPLVNTFRSHLPQLRSSQARPAAAASCAQPRLMSQLIPVRWKRCNNKDDIVPLGNRIHRGARRRLWHLRIRHTFRLQALAETGISRGNSALASPTRISLFSGSFVFHFISFQWEGVQAKKPLSPALPDTFPSLLRQSLETSQGTRPARCHSSGFGNRCDDGGKGRGTGSVRWDE